MKSYSYLKGNSKVESVNAGQRARPKKPYHLRHLFGYVASHVKEKESKHSWDTKRLLDAGRISRPRKEFRSPRSFMWNWELSSCLRRRISEVESNRHQRKQGQLWYFDGYVWQRVRSRIETAENQRSKAKGSIEFGELFHIIGAVPGLCNIKIWSVCTREIPWELLWLSMHDARARRSLTRVEMHIDIL